MICVHGTHTLQGGHSKNPNFNDFFLMLALVNFLRWEVISNYSQNKLQLNWIIIFFWEKWYNFTINQIPHIDF